MSEDRYIELAFKKLLKKERSVSARTLCMECEKKINAESSYVRSISGITRRLRVNGKEGGGHNIYSPGINALNLARLTLRQVNFSSRIYP